MNDIKGFNLCGLNFALLLTCNTAKDFSKTNIDKNNPVNITEQMCRYEQISRNRRK